MEQYMYKKCENAGCIDKLVEHYHQVELPKLPNARKPYYKVQDGMFELRGVFAEEYPNELELRKLLHIAQDALFKFETELSKKYNWG